jgi:hypothetical protein
MTAVAFTAAQRAARRADIRRRCLDRAEADAHRLARSITCAAGRHDTCVGHLRVNGGVCLCECHDEPEATP